MSRNEVPSFQTLSALCPHVCLIWEISNSSRREMGKEEVVAGRFFSMLCLSLIHISEPTRPEPI
eukprot:1937236-Pyramimonas_sp.AAC.1